MSVHHLKTQAGYMLLLTLLALMAMGGVVLVGFSQEAKQQVDHERYLHNKRVLEEAKQALLMYAYNYAVNNPGRGPGRLPCPDTSNNGSPNTTFNCISVTPIVGRFPYSDPDMNLYEILDASGERLWYAVSQNFAHSISPLSADVINSDTAGTITIHDQSGAIRYDNGIGGIAAVIIAPGPEIDRNGTAQNRAADINNPIHFLDLFGALDNSDFVNGDVITPSANGFVLGPIFDANGDVIVNDQMILITADEVTAMAEKAVLEAYRDAIDDYQQTIWAAVANYRYPWMNAYADITDLNIFDVVPGKRIGRVPFLHYYTDHDSHVVITDLQIDYDIDLIVTSLADDADLFDPTYIDVFGNLFTSFFPSTATLDITDSNLRFAITQIDGSTPDDTDDIGTMITETGVAATVFASPGPISRDRYFWDELGSPNGWELCPVSFGDERDCARNLANTAFIAWDVDWINHADIRIRFVRLELNMDPEFVIEFDYDPYVPTNTYTAPTTLPANAQFTATHDVASIDAIGIADTNFTSATNFIDLNVLYCEQDNDVTNAFNIDFLGNADGGSAVCTPNLNLVATATVSQFNVTADYYPELPFWVKRNQWQDSIMMAYAGDYEPGGDTNCLLPGPGNTCLIVTNNYDNKLNGINHKLLLLGAGSIPVDSADLENIFHDENNAPDEDRNSTLNDTFTAHPDSGYDAMLTLDET